MRTDPTPARPPDARWATVFALLLAAGPTPAADYVFADGLEDVIHPLPGEVIVTEEMSNPVLAPDADGEWFELLNVGTQTVELTNRLVGDDPVGDDAVPPLKRAGPWCSCGTSISWPTAACAISTYVLIAIVKKALQLDASLYTLLQILSVSIFEKTEISCALQPGIVAHVPAIDAKQLILFGS